MVFFIKRRNRQGGGERNDHKERGKGGGGRNNSRDESRVLTSRATIGNTIKVSVAPLGCRASLKVFFNPDLLIVLFLYRVIHVIYTVEITFKLCV